MKKVKFPSAQTVLLIIAAFVALLNWVIPSGQYDRLAYNKEDNSFIKTSQQKLIENKDGAKTLNQKLKKPTLKERDHLLTRFQIQQKKLQYKTVHISEKNLDTLILPHPLMGKMTVREIIMWTAYHTEHHTTTLQNLY